MYKPESKADAANPFLRGVIASQSQAVEVWPENWPVFEVFSRVGTQWNVSMGGPTGLRYEAIYPLIDRMCEGEWLQMFDDLQVMERAALDLMREKD